MLKKFSDYNKDDYYVSVSNVYVDGVVMCSQIYFSDLEIDRIRSLVDRLGGDSVPSDSMDYDRCDCLTVYDVDGAPKEVGGDFNCYNNQLTSLEGAPEEVGGHFDCQDNQLTSLEGAPRQVGGNFYCSYNQLTSLEGSPDYVGGNFYCSYNQLSNLKGAPKQVGGGFYCGNNQLIDLQGAPSYVGGVFYCYNNPLPEEILNFEDIKYILKWQDEYNIWKKDGSLDLFRFKQMIDDYDK